MAPVRKHPRRYVALVSAEVGYVIGEAGLGVALVRELIAGRERRRARPVVIAHEAHKSGPTGDRQAAAVYLTNESAASAFNVRFGIKMGESLVSWKHDPRDREASRLNVLRPGAREPVDGALELIIPDLFARDAAEDGRSYWALYQGPGGEWYSTFNPVSRSDELIIEAVRSRRWGRWSR